MIFGVGIDIEDHNRFYKYLEQKNESESLLPVYTQSLLPVYTQKELYNYVQFNNHLCFAISFCCKEAFFKAFGTSWNNSAIEWHNIELFFYTKP